MVLVTLGEIVQTVIIIIIVIEWIQKDYMMKGDVLTVDKVVI